MRKKLSLIFLPLLVCISFAGTATAKTAKSTWVKQDGERQLTDAQLKSIKSIQIKAAKLAVPLGLHLALVTRKVYENMLREKEDVKLRAQLSADMHKTAGELLTIKGQSIREVLRVLTPEQRRLIKTEMGKPDAPADLMELIVRAFNIPEK